MVEPRPLVSIVSPVYNAGTIVEELVSRVRASVADLGTYEIVLVDDRSIDNSWTEICRMCEKHDEMRGIRLSRNFGQHAAIAAGLSGATGQYVVVMDCDLQDDPGYIPSMLALAQNGADVVLTERRLRRHSMFRNLAARVYTKIVSVLSGNQRSRLGQGSYSLINRKVVDAFLELRDIHVHYLGTLAYLGFNQEVIEVEHSERFDGKSSYTFRELGRHAVDGIVSQSLRLLYLAVSIGMGLFLVSMLGVVYLVVSYFIRGALAGFTSIMVMILLTSGVVLMSVGVVGVYVGRVFEQVKARPRFIVDVTANDREVDVSTDDKLSRHDG